jgi:hypothetical protein
VLALGSVSLAFVPQPPRTRGELVRIKRVTMGFLWVILIGFIAGIIARLVSRGHSSSRSSVKQSAGIALTKAPA